ncbi:MAG: VirB3 family type IV secretion system protein [Bacteroidetes bacterium]|nr:VirB3 family type IV secretion system protein [Bacteroidota bacterium]MCY4205141.1 VirB3 family type IV secretion system protein [Bacteroidota bacterium]
MSVPGEELQTAPVHTSLQRRPTMGGLPQDAFLLLALIMVTMCIASRLDPKVLACCGIAYLILLPLLRRIFEKDPFFMSILPRALRYAPRYLRQEKEMPRRWQDRISRRP